MVSVCAWKRVGASRRAASSAVHRRNAEGERASIQEIITWGQRAIWEAIERTRPDDHYFNFGRVLPLGARRGGRCRGRPCGRWAAWPSGTESLRTPWSRGGGQSLKKANGELTESETRGRPGRAAGRDGRRAVRLRDQWPLRAGLVLSGPGEVTHLVLVFCHLAADGLGAEQAIRDLRFAAAARRRPRG